MAIQRKIILLFLITALLPFIAMCLVIFLDFRHVLEKSVDSKLNSLATIQKSRTLHVINENQELIKNLALTPQLVNETSSYLLQPSSRTLKTLEETLEHVKTQVPSAQSISIANVKGTIIASTKKELVGENISNTPRFKKSLIKPDVSTFYLDKNDKVINTLVAPVKTNHVIGTILVDTNTYSYFDIFHDYTGLGETGDWGLSAKTENGDALILIPSRFEKRKGIAGKMVLKKSETSLPSIRAISGKESIYSLTDFRGKSVVAATRYIPETEWGIVVKVDTSEAYAAISDLENQLLFFAGLLILFILFLGSFISQIITEPIRRLTSASKNIAAGDLSTTIMATSNDEIGELAKTFREMTIRLRESYATLKAQVKKESNIIDSVGEGLMVIDTEGHILIVNKAIKQMLGLQDTN